MIFSPTSYSQNPNSSPSQRIRAAQIICGAMVMGILIFMVIALSSPGDGKRVGAGPLPMVSMVGLGAAVVNFLLQFIIPGIVASFQINKLKVEAVADRSADLFSIFQIRMIIRLALLEGASLFNLIGYMVERQWWTIAIVALLLTNMILCFPTLNQFDSWADDVRRTIENRF